MLTFNPDEARKADRFSNVIRDAGAYKGTITRAEKLVSEKGTEGLGLSFTADDGSTASFLDVYTIGSDGKVLMGSAIVQALMCCLKLRTANIGKINFQTWDRQNKTAEGYPDIMGKKIGFVFRRELQVNNRSGEDQERLIIVGVFQYETGLMASEILDRKTSAELLPKMTDWVKLNPVKDTRKRNGGGYSRTIGNGVPGREDGDPGATDSDIPF